jgi:hypothetical protein
MAAPRERSEVKIDFWWALGQAEDLLRSGLKSRPVREAEKRLLEHRARQVKGRFEQRTREIGRRIGRAATVTGVSGVSVLGYGLAVAPLSTAGLIAAGTGTAAAALAALSWPGKRNAAPAPELPLQLLPLRTEEYLLQQRANLPARAHPALDAIHDRLAELGRHIGALDPGAPLAGEARRLTEQHLPRLIDSFLALPRAARTPDVAARLAASLATVADELERLTAEIGRDRLLSFETQERFIHSRYKERGW